MGRPLDQDLVKNIEAWYTSDVGRACFSMQLDLMKRLVGRHAGRRFLDVGCGTGWHLQAFKREGLAVTGIDPSPEVLEAAGRRLGAREHLHLGRAEDLPFEDNEFDVVTMFNCLEAVGDREAALNEAFRVARSCVFIGVINSLSLASVGWRLEGIVSRPEYRRTHFYTVWELKRMLAGRTDPRRIRWATVGLLPPSWAARIPDLESSPRLQRWPFGSFLGMAADTTYIARADGLAVKARHKRPRAVAATAPTTCRPCSRRESRPGSPAR